MRIKSWLALVRVANPAAPAILDSAVVKRQNILISGGTGTGKTTLLNIIAHFIRAQKRILIIDDTAEIQIAAANLVRFEARVAQNGIPAAKKPDVEIPGRSSRN